MDRVGLTRAEEQLRVALALLVGFPAAAFTVMYVVMAVTDDSHYPFAGNSLSKDILWLALTAVAIVDIRRYSLAVVLLVLSHLALVLGLALVLIFGDISNIDGTLDPSWLPFGITPGTLVWIWGVADVLVAAVLTWLWRRARRAN